jgi:hypothetical protein
MKKLALLLTLVMVLGLGASAMAATTTVGGEVRYVYAIPGDSSAATDSTQFRVKVSSQLSDATNALIWLRSTSANGTFDTVLAAELTTKFKGIGTLALGNTPDYGTSPFVAYGSVWGATDPGREVPEVAADPIGISFATETFAGVSAQALVSLVPDDNFFGGEVTYALPMLKDSTVGVSFNKKGSDELALAAIANAKVAGVTVYGEVGKTAGASELDVKTLGATATVAGVALYAETDLQAEKNYLQATKSFNSVSYNASYTFGNGYGAADDGKIKVWAKVSF